MSLVLGAVGRGALDRRDIQRGRHVLDDSVQKLLDSLVEVCGTAADRDSLVPAGALAQRSLQLFNGGLLALQILLHQVFVQIADLLDHLGVPLLCLILHISRDILDSDVLTLVVVIDISLHLHDVDDTLEVVLLADGQLDADRVLAQTMLDLVDGHKEVCAHDVHLVDECDTRHAVGICLTPDILGLGLDAALCVKDADCAVKDTQGTLDLDGEVDVSGGVDNVDTVLKGTGFGLGLLLQRPMAGGSCGSDGDASLLLLRHVVHGGSAFVGLTDLVIDTGIIEDTLGQSGLARVDMRHDTDVSGPIQRILTFFNSSQLGFLLIRICSAQMPCLLRPSCAYLLFS